ncbi:hypothetical protein FALCPG4_015850 [Fusarium falciforme]
MASMSPPLNTSTSASGASSNNGNVSPQQTASPKNVAFEVLFLDCPQYPARLPMRVQIYPHDTTDSIRFAQDISRPSSRSSRRRSPSPNTARGRRSASASTNGKKGRSRSSKNRGSTVRSHTELYSDSITGYSRADEHGSTSGKNKEQQPTTDISVENIVKGGRRKRAKFETSVSGDRLVASKD